MEQREDLNSQLRLQKPERSIARIYSLDAGLCFCTQIVPACHSLKGDARGISYTEPAFSCTAALAQLQAACLHREVELKKKIHLGLSSRAHKNSQDYNSKMIICKTNMLCDDLKSKL